MPHGFFALTAQEYLAFAKECTVWAMENDDGETRIALLQIACDWTRAAMAAAEHEKETGTS